MIQLINKSFGQGFSLGQKNKISVERYTKNKTFTHLAEDEREECYLKGKAASQWTENNFNLHEVIRRDFYIPCIH